MRLSTKSRYGLRILLQIGIENKDGKLANGKLISEKQEISEPYLEQIMIPLKNAGFVKTVRGCNGGYLLNKKPELISVLDVIELFEGELKIVDCTSEKTACTRNDSCMTTNVWKTLAKSLRDSASSITLKKILDENFKKSGSEYII